MYEPKSVFISYKSEDFDEANWIKSTLEKNGISCWMAPGSIPGGSSYAKEIPLAIKHCKVFVLVVSEKCQTSMWVPKEIDQAINLGKVILPFMLENCPLQDDFNFYLSNVQRYAAFENKSNAIKRMIDEINAILGCSAPKEEPQATDTVEEVLPPEVKTEVEETPEVIPQVTPTVTFEAAPQVKPLPNIEPKPKKAKKRKKNKLKGMPNSKKKDKIRDVFLSLAAIISLIVVIALVYNVTNNVTIAGEKVKKNISNYSNAEVQFTPEDVVALSKLENLSSFEITNCTVPHDDFSFLDGKNLHSLTLSNCNVSNETFEQFNVGELSNLDISDNEEFTELTDILDYSKTLQTLNISRTNVEESESAYLAEFNLKYLSASSISGLRLSSVAANGNLNELDISRCDIKSLSNLSDLENLELINISNNPLKSLKGLENCIYLAVLDAHGCKLTSLEGLENTTRLEYVDLCDNSLTDISLLSNSLETITHINVSYNGELYSIDALGGTQALEILYADGCMLSSLPDLSNSANLRAISVPHNKITDISPLSNCGNLQYIYLQDNNITDVSCLSDMPYGEETYVSINLSNNTELASVALPLFCKIQKLYLHNTAVSDLSPLDGMDFVELSLTYTDNLDILPVASENIHLTDCPKNKIVEFEEIVKSNNGIFTLATIENLDSRLQDEMETFYDHSFYY